MNKLFVSSDSFVDEALELLGDGYGAEKLIKLDTETSGLNPFKDKLWSVQLGNFTDVNVLFPFNALNKESRGKVEKFMADKTAIAHNAKFDYKFLKMAGFNIPNVYCTKESERVLWCGKYFTFSLKDLLFRRYQIEMSKEARTQFYDGTFQRMIDELGDWGAWSDELIEYALEDIVYLDQLYLDQTDESNKMGLQNVVWLENKEVIVTANLELRGVWLDAEEVKKFASEISLKRDEQAFSLNKELRSAWEIAWQKEYAKRIHLWDAWNVEHKRIVEETRRMKDPENKRKKTSEALELVEQSNKNKPFSAKPKQEKEFNPNSSTQLREALSHIVGFPVESTKNEWLEENVDLHPVLETLMEHRKYTKLAQFATIIDQIEELTGRIHAYFDQLGTKTGRYTCSNPNLQQIPVRSKEGAAFRALFKAMKGRKLVGADFAGIELVILAGLSGEKLLIEAINKGWDVHCFTMSLFLKCPYELIKLAKDKLPLSDKQTNELLAAREGFERQFQMPELGKQETLYDWVKKLRDYTKTMTYGVVYGLSEYGLSNKFHCSFDDAKAFIELIFSYYTAIRLYLAESGLNGLQQGYNSTLLGRRRWFIPPRKKNYAEIEALVISKLKKQKRLWDSVTDEEWEGLIEEETRLAEREFNAKINRIKRMSANAAIQGLSADITKLAMYIFERDYKGEGGLILTVHDELWAEVPEEEASRASECLKTSMTYAAKKFLPEMRIDVDPVISDFWVK
jgi:DNA polymerase I-like protein with 3'-5' exonuclease and polymerase domains